MPPVPLTEETLFAGFGRPVIGDDFSNSLTDNNSLNTGSIAGNTVFFGRAGNDRIQDNSGSDVDIYVGGAGNDTLIGGPGTDIFLYFNDVTYSIPLDPTDAGVSFSVTSVNGTDGIDQIQNFRAAEGDAVLVVRNGTNGSDSMLGNSNNEFLSGLDGNDSIFGGAGNDILAGGVGDDILDGGYGNNILIGGVGSDRYNFMTSSIVVTKVNLDGGESANDLMVEKYIDRYDFSQRRLVTTRIPAGIDYIVDYDATQDSIFLNYNPYELTDSNGNSVNDQDDFEHLEGVDLSGVAGGNGPVFLPIDFLQLINRLTTFNEFASVGRGLLTGQRVTLSEVDLRKFGELTFDSRLDQSLKNVTSAIWNSYFSKPYESFRNQNIGVTQIRGNLFTNVSLIAQLGSDIFRLDRSALLSPAVSVPIVGSAQTNRYAVYDSGSLQTPLGSIVAGVLKSFESIDQVQNQDLLSNQFKF